MRAIFSLTVVVSVVAAAAPVSASASCSFHAGTATVRVDLGASGDTGRVSTKSGGKIALDGKACGAAHVTTTDLIVVNGPPSEGGELQIDFLNGRFLPGLSDEPGDSDEIEFSFDHGSGGGTLRVLAHRTADHITVGADGINLNAGETGGVDADVTFRGVDLIVLEGLDGNDVLSAAGGAGTGAPSTIPVELYGDSGADRLSGGDAGDALRGGAGFDTADYGARTDDLFLSVGDGANDGRPGEGDAIAADLESVVGGSGNDTLIGDDSAELLIGGPGDDTIEGNGGDDQLEGGEGEDVLRGAGGDDLLMGGPGDDHESGAGFNDIFLQTPKTVFSYQGDQVKIPDTGKAVLKLDVPVAGTILDLDARIDIEHDHTDHLYVTLIAPNGKRTSMSRNRTTGTEFRGTTFDSEAVANVRNAVDDPFENRFHPDGAMSFFDGMDTAGEWRLRATDSVAGSHGRLNFLSLDVTYATPGDDGADVLDGGVSNRDLADYTGRIDPLTVTLQGDADDGRSGEGDDAGVGGSIEDVYGGIGDDHLVGTDGPNDIRPHEGDDVVDLLGGNDNARGGAGNDTIYGRGGRDFISGQGGDDLIDGGQGIDTSSYTEASSAIQVDLVAGTVTGGHGNDTLVGVENITGTKHDDRIRGDHLANALVGKRGDDELYGGDGDDVLDGGEGSDRADGGPGVDVCRNAEVRIDCEG